MNQERTKSEYASAMSICRRVFERKMSDYGTSWRIMRPKSLTDQILIKARRIRQLEETGEARVSEGIFPEFVAIVNYSIMALIQLAAGPGDSFAPETALRLYDDESAKAGSLMFDKNHDYDEAWRVMRVSSFTDIILQKLCRTRELEDHDGKTCCSEGIDANYLDIINYALFAIIRLSEEAGTEGFHKG